MRRLAVLCDVHGNLPALEAVLREVRAAGVEQVVIGGDTVMGPLPRETMACLLALGDEVPVRFVMGNADREVLAALRGEETAAVPERFRGSLRWVAEQLREYEPELAGWPLTYQTAVEVVGDVLVCHATPRNDTEIFTSLTAEEKLLPIFGGLGVDVVVCGHTHMQFDRTIGQVRVVNAGSVGMPYTPDGEARACWALLGPGVALRQTPYDLAPAAERIKGTAYPLAKEFVRENVLRTPPEAEALAVFGRAELT